VRKNWKRQKNDKINENRYWQQEVLTVIHVRWFSPVALCIVSKGCKLLCYTNTYRCQLVLFILESLYRRRVWLGLHVFSPPEHVLGLQVDIVETGEYVTWLETLMGNNILIDECQYLQELLNYALCHLRWIMIFIPHMWGLNWGSSSTMVFTPGPMGLNTRHLWIPSGPWCSNSPSSRVIWRATSAGATLVICCKMCSSAADPDISETRIFRAIH